MSGSTLSTALSGTCVVFAIIAFFTGGVWFVSFASRTKTIAMQATIAAIAIAATCELSAIWVWAATA